MAQRYSAFTSDAAIPLADFRVFSLGFHFFLPYLGLFFLMIPMEDNARAFDHIGLQ